MWPIQIHVGTKIHCEPKNHQRPLNFSKNIVSLVHHGAFCALLVHIAPSWCTSTPYTVVVVYNVPWVHPDRHTDRQIFLRVCLRVAVLYALHIIEQPAYWLIRLFSIYLPHTRDTTWASIWYKQCHAQTYCLHSEKKVPKQYPFFYCTEKSGAKMAPPWSCFGKRLHFSKKPWGKGEPLYENGSTEEPFWLHFSIEEQFWLQPFFSEWQYPECFIVAHLNLILNLPKEASWSDQMRSFQVNWVCKSSGYRISMHVQSFNVHASTGGARFMEWISMFWLLMLPIILMWAFHTLNTLNIVTGRGHVKYNWICESSGYWTFQCFNVLATPRMPTSKWSSIHVENAWVVTRPPDRTNFLLSIAYTGGWQ